MLNHGCDPPIRMTLLPITAMPAGSRPDQGACDVTRTHRALAAAGADDIVDPATVVARLVVVDGGADEEGMVGDVDETCALEVEVVIVVVRGIVEERFVTLVPSSLHTSFAKSCPFTRPPPKTRMVLKPSLTAATAVTRDPNSALFVCRVHEAPTSVEEYTSLAYFGIEMTVFCNTTHSEDAALDASDGLPCRVHETPVSFDAQKSPVPSDVPARTVCPTTTVGGRL